MKLNLSSDGGVTAFLELRAKGSNFSQNLSPETTVIATNGLDPNSDRHWAVNGLYRRSVHLLNDGTELQAVNDTWDFATASKFPVKGCVAEVADIRTIRGSIPVYRIRVEREQAEYIDLYFQDHVPSWKSPDIWVDWQGDNPDSSVRPGCSNDSGFLLTAWRRAGEADEIWSSCFYHIRPRFRTNLELVRGTWLQGRIVVHGLLHVLADMAIDLTKDQPLVAWIRMLTDEPNGAVVWRAVPIQSDGRFVLNATVENGKTMVVEAWFDRTNQLGSSVSNEITLKQAFIG
jgi:hypothetical protein